MDVRSFRAVAALLVCLSGCAHQNGVGSAPGSVTGRAQSDPRLEKPKGEHFRTETLTPGVGSALFPDPAWR